MKKLRKYLITLIVGFSIVGLIIWSKDLAHQTELSVIFHILTDAFCVAGVLLTCAGLLVFSSNEGTFDIVVYGFSSFIDIFRKVSKKKYETFYDYRESRADKKVKCLFLIICGLFFLIISLIMYLLYRRFI
jgi:hypothetical protein